MLLLETFISYLKCGILKKDSRYSVYYYVVSNIQDVVEKIIPFFQKHMILGVKSLDFKDWCLVSEMIKKEEHKSVEGAIKIREIQRGMNRGRS